MRFFNLILILASGLLTACANSYTHVGGHGHYGDSSDDPRALVDIPDMMQEHMLSNMRDHLAVINELLSSLASNELDKAADIAEARLGMSSLESHGASHMARYMPEGMRSLGTGMHKAASRFALKAQEGDQLEAYQALGDITASCVACHSAYRIR